MMMERTPNRMIKPENLLSNVKTIGITGHIKPDGDCVGASLAIYNYIKDNMPDIDVDVYLEEFPVVFNFLNGADCVKRNCNEDKVYDLFITVDSSDLERIGKAKKYYDCAKKTLCIDHHITNSGFGDERYILSDASSCCEVLYDLLDEDKISKNTAECIYTGIVHDTGVFKYEQTSAKTMLVASKMMDKGIDFTSIIDDTYYKKTYIQNQILGRALLESTKILDGKCIFSILHRREMEFYNAHQEDLEGIVEMLRNTKGVEVAIFAYEIGFQKYKVSLRSNECVDVSRIALNFGGGGHIRAAGCTINGQQFDVINSITYYIEQQLDKE